MLYSVINTKGNILGHFLNIDEAKTYVVDYWYHTGDNLKIKPITKEEYLEYTRKLIDKYTD